jgi:hypothetical protein
MEIQEALAIMRALANGLNPATAQPLDAQSVCHQPEVIKALNRSINALVHEEQREKNKPSKAFKAWSQAEIAQVCEEVRKGMDFQEIAKAHHRTVAAIVARLVKLGKIQPPKPRVA